jgi:hypothetical protein
MNKMTQGQKMRMALQGHMLVQSTKVPDTMSRDLESVARTSNSVAHAMFESIGLELGIPREEMNFSARNPTRVPLQAGLEAVAAVC